MDCFDLERISTVFLVLKKMKTAIVSFSYRGGSVSLSHDQWGMGVHRTSHRKENAARKPAGILSLHDTKINKKKEGTAILWGIQKIRSNWPGSVKVWPVDKKCCLVFRVRLRGWSISNAHVPRGYVHREHGSVESFPLKTKGSLPLDESPQPLYNRHVGFEKAEVQAWTTKHSWCRGWVEHGASTSWFILQMSLGLLGRSRIHLVL